MTKRVGILGLMVAAAIGLFQPAVASAQDRYDSHRVYAQREYQDRDWHRDNRWRVTRERQDWREHEWRERGRYDNRYYAPYSSYGYGYIAPPPVVRFGWYGR
jgi:hypothetical protein